MLSTISPSSSSAPPPQDHFHNDSPKSGDKNSSLPAQFQTQSSDDELTIKLPLLTSENLLQRQEEEEQVQVQKGNPIVESSNNKEYHLHHQQQQ